jgi:hypothetical protein
MQSLSDPRVFGSRIEPDTSRTADMRATRSTATFGNEYILIVRGGNGEGNKYL